MTSPRLALLGTQEEERGLVGLQNIGNTCYLNSVTQCLSNTRPLLEYILDREYLSDVQSSSGCVLVGHFAGLIRELWSPPRSRYLSPRAFKLALDLYAPRFGGSRQQDAQECLKYLLEGLHDEVNRAPILNNARGNQNDSYAPNQTYSADETWRRYLNRDNSKISDIFAGLLRSDLKCMRCGSTSTIYEPFWDLSLPIPSGKASSVQINDISLRHCLELFTKEEELNGNEMPNCSSCERKRPSTKRISIERFPKILVIHLKRFSSVGLSYKVDRIVDFPHEDLNMESYSARDKAKGPIYKLYGIVNHYGTISIGHYKAICRHPYSGRWHSFNDTTVRREDIDLIDKSPAYILFYELKRPSTI